MSDKTLKPKILIVDDKPENLLVLEKLLKELEVDTIKALSGADALTLALEHEFCVAIIDVQMPEMDGYELIDLLRSNAGTATLPVIFVSAIYSDEFHYRKGYEAGAVDFISKPIVAEVLISKVKVFVELYQQRKAIEETNAILVKRANQLETGTRVSQQITSILELDELLHEVAWAIQTRFDFFFVGIWVPNEKRDKLVLKTFTCREDQVPEYQVTIPITDSENALQKAYQTGEVNLVSDQETEVNLLGTIKLVGPRIQLVFPLQLGTLRIGLLDIRNDQSDVFDEMAKQVLLMLANQATIAMVNAMRYKHEKELRNIEVEKAQILAKLNADKDKFFSIISHDLRSPFNILLGNTQLLSAKIDKLSKEDTIEMAEEIYQRAKAACSLLDNLLTWSQMQREGGIKCKPETIQLDQLANDVISILNPTALQKEITLGNTITPDLSVQADRFMVETVIRNLIGNALKFTRRNGTVTLGALAGDGIAGAGFITVCVEDTGIGMSSTDRDKLFRIDTKHTTPGTENEKGTGLGLVICKEMVEQNGGKIWVESEQGKGTAIKFSLPQSG